MSTTILEPPTRCRRCNRVLTDPRSIKRGYGRECIETINLEVDLTDQARTTNEWGFLCQACERPTPPELFRKGQCPRCYYGVAKFEDLDVEPFAEVG